MGEADIRSNIANGDGVYKSTDAGKTWKHMGLKMADAVGTIEVHPTNPDIAYVAALGNPFAPNKERGVFRTTDGGKTWKPILTKNDSTGAIVVKLDPNNPSIVYASMWQAYRNSYMMSSGGPGCGLFKSTDGGDTWTSLSTKPGHAQRACWVKSALRFRPLTPTACMPWSKTPKADCTAPTMPENRGS